MKKFITAFLIIFTLLAVPSFASEVYDSKNFTVKASSEKGNSTIRNAFDGEANYLWHSDYTDKDGEITGQDKAPFYVDIVFPEAIEVGGIRYTPRQLNQGNSGAGIWQKGNVEGSTNGIDFFEIGSFAMPNDIITTRKITDIPVKNGTYKAIKIIITQSESDFCTAAEIEVLKSMEGRNADIGEIYDSKGWVVTASSTLSENDSIYNAFNDDMKWLWHSAYTVENGEITGQDKPPFTIDIVFPEHLNVGGVRYVPRQLTIDNSGAGIWKRAEFYGSVDGVNYKKIGEKAYPNNLTVTRETVDAYLEEGFYKALRIVITEADSDFATAAEIDVFAPGSKNAVTEEKKPVLKDKNNWTIKSNSSSVGPERAIDDDKNSYWHSKFTANDAIVVWKEEPPYTLDITFPEDVVISGLSYLPRQDSPSGRFTEAELWVSDTADGELKKIRDLEFSGSASKADIKFYGNIKVRKVRMNITSSGGGVATVAELDFMEEDKNLDMISYDEFILLEEKNKLYQIDKTRFSAETDFDTWGGKAVAALDKSNETFWQTETGVEAPWTYTVDMNDTYTLVGFSYTPRQTDDFHGVWHDFEVEASLDGKNWDFVFSDYTDENSLETRMYRFTDKVTARYIRFYILSGYSGRAACSDINFFQAKDDYEDELIAKKESYKLKIDSNEIVVEKNGETTTKVMDVAPFIDPASSSTLIPLRGLLEEMGAEISWEGYNQTVTIKTATGNITMQIRNNLVYVDDPTYGPVRYTLRVAPEIKDSRTFIPLRFVSENLGYKVEWNGETREITITK